MPKRKLQRKWKIFWSVFAATVAAIFAVAEGYTLSTPEGGDTLSEQIWALQEAYGSIVYVGGGAVIAWASWHFSIFEKARKRLGPKPGGKR